MDAQMPQELVSSNTTNKNGLTVGEDKTSNIPMKQAEFCGHFDPNNGPKHRPLTLIRKLRGFLCLMVLLSSAFMALVYWAPFTAVMFRLFSIHYSRKATSFLFGVWLSLWPFLFEKINQTKVVFSGETVPAEERVLLLANHRTEVDWMYLWDLALRKGRLGYIKYILKSSLMRLPIFGWGFHILEFISVERRWEVDEPTMRQMLSTFLDPQDPLWLAVFPEGTDFTEQKCERSQKFAKENGLPILQNVLLPKTKGFYSCLSALRSSLDAGKKKRKGRERATSKVSPALSVCPRYEPHVLHGEQSRHILFARPTQLCGKKLVTHCHRSWHTLFLYPVKLMALP